MPGKLNLELRVFQFYSPLARAVGVVTLSFALFFTSTASAVVFVDRYSTSADGTTHKPITIRDPRTDITFYVHGDRRHISAIDRDWQVLWTRDPFVEAHLVRYRVGFPMVTDIIVSARIGKNFPAVEILFNSSQFGFMNQYTGYFMFEGNN